MQMPRVNSGLLAQKSVVIDALRAALGADRVVSNPAETLAYECDALSAYRCPPMGVVLPRSTEEVALALKICHGFGVPVVPRGAGTSLTGGVLPTADSIVLSVARLTKVLEVSLADRLIKVEAGITNISVTQAVEADGFFYAPDPSSQLACAIAGNIGMNSGGAHCLKYGVTTQHVLGVTLVTVEGDIIEIGGPAMDAPGLNLLSVICGSEGQLGIVTEAWLRILPKAEGARPVLIAFDAARTAGACVSDIIKTGVLPVAIEFMDSPCIKATEAFSKAGYPDCEALLIIEVEGSDEEMTHQLGVIAQVARRHHPIEIRESASDAESARIWLGRKAAFGAMGALGDYICLDGTIPVSELADVLDKITEATARYGLRVSNVFHAGDGNMHPLIIYDAAKEGDLAKAEALGAEILTICVEAGGCLSGEHGIGVEKRDLMQVQFTGADLEAQMRVKDVFDPRWLLNPAKVFPLELSEERRGC